MQLSEEQLMLRASVRELAESRIKPRAAEIDETDEFPWDIKGLLAKNELLGLPIPEEYGGSGADLLTVCLVVEELSRVSAAVGLIVAVQELGALPIILAGNEEQKERFLPRLASGDSLISYGLTEPEAGSDVAAARTTAVRQGDNYILNGTKRFITGAGTSDLYVIFASTNPAAAHRGISAFVVEKDAPGFSIGKIEHKMGIRGSKTGDLLMTDCVVPAANLLGKEGEGFKIAMRVMDRSRPGIAAQALGIAQGAIEVAADFIKTRQQFNAPIASFQGIRFMVADMATSIEASRLLLYHACEEIERGSKEGTKLSSMAKLFCSDTAMQVTTDAVQLLGGYGYVREYPVERMMRDAKITQIYEGTNQIQRIVIAKSYLG